MLNHYEEFIKNGQPEQALLHIQELIQSDTDNSELWNDAGVILHLMHKYPEAVECFETAHELCDDNDDILINLQKAYTELYHGKKIKIAFFCGADGPTFLHDIVNYARDRFEVRIFNGNSKEELFQLMEWSDISWFEWCTNLAVIGTEIPRNCRTIIRLHRYEAYTEWPQHIKWENVDLLITIGNDVVRKKLVDRVPDIEKRTEIVDVPNAVNIKRFQFQNKQKGKNLAFVANLSMKKNPVLLLHSFEKLYRMDPEYRLYIAGRWDDDVLKQYMDYMVSEFGLIDSVIYEGWQDNINDWLEDKHYIICSSIVEGHPVGIMEGMARGLKPIIHTFPGVRKFFPPEYLFSTPEEFCQRIICEDYEPARYRAYVEQNYPLSGQLSVIGDLIQKLMIKTGLNTVKQAV